MNLSTSDLTFIEKKGITAEKLHSQLKMLKEGFPFLKLQGAATPAKGIVTLTPEMEKHSTEIWHQYLEKGAKVVKMVPASGAASRMFKDLFAFVNGKSEKPDNDFIKKFFNEIENFAFFAALNAKVLEKFGKSIHSMVKEGKYKDVVRTLLEESGLNYGQLPKGLLSFHKVMGGSRTPLEEHISEGIEYARGKDGKVHIHFTVSPEHRALMEKKIEEVKGVFEDKNGVKLDVEFSEQKPSTDTVAATLDNQPYREEGKLFFRPGGHGALIENLNEINADVVFIKNIDNVLPDEKRVVSNTFKKVIGGILVASKQKADEYCRILKDDKADEAKLKEMEKFLAENLNIVIPEIEKLTAEEKKKVFFEKLNRPMRVCGMVKNEGEPGGGPFIVVENDGSTSLQILESSQIDTNDKKAVKMLKESTHFNPVDLVCAIKDFEGKHFNLPDYVDVSTGFISSKSIKGVEIKALELPGLWNGAMSRWNTIFVEVPAETFNPVKTVNDLLRIAHQA